MHPSSLPVPARSGSLWAAIVVGGLAAGVGDLAFAILHFHEVRAVHLLQFIAAGLIGKTSAFGGGYPTVALGVVLHFVVAIGAAAVFVLAGRKLTMLARFPGPAGLVYGAVVYFVMTLVIVPLSRVAGPEYPPGVDWGALAGHMALVGLPIALATRWFGPRTIEE